jgi:aerobic-type carbon monoxide dehydrogenase small subunit (CoxS/CutS family)
MMDTITFTLNGKEISLKSEANKPLLWALREDLKLKGTKFGCGIGQCGACTVQMNGEAVRSCSLPMSAVQDQKVTTIEGVGAENLHPIQQAWLELQVPQCGYCQSGQIMSAITLLEKNSQPTDEDIFTAMNGNLCRCGTYDRIIKGIKLAVSNKNNEL